MRTKITKAASKADDSQPHELTNITVKEVSVVDRAANKRTFLVTKNDKNPRTETALSFLASRRSTATGGDLASDLDARDAQNVQKTDAEKLIEAKDAADAVAFAAEKASLVKGEEGGDTVITAEPVAAPAAAPVAAAPVVDAAKALAALAASVEPTTPTKKDDLPVAVTIVADPEPLSESAIALKTAILAGIDLISKKVGEWRTAVESADKNNTDVSGRPYCMWEQSYYLTRMIENLSGIGGPDWDVLNATIGKVAKSGNKAITATRVGVLKGVHEGLQHCTGTMSKVMKELTDETPDEVVSPDASASFAKANTPVVAPVPAPVVAPVPVVVAADPAMVAKMDGIMKAVASMQDIIATQAIELQKARGEVSSNAI